METAKISDFSDAWKLDEQIDRFSSEGEFHHPDTFDPVTYTMIHACTHGQYLLV